MFILIMVLCVFVVPPVQIALGSNQQLESEGGGEPAGK